MDDQLLRTIDRLNRQLRAIKLMLGFFFVLLVAMLAILGFITYKVITFTQDISTRINNFESKTTESLNLKKRMCDNESLTSFLGSNNDLCAKQ